MAAAMCLYKGDKSPVSPARDQRPTQVGESGHLCHSQSRECPAQLFSAHVLFFLSASSVGQVKGIRDSRKVSWATVALCLGAHCRSALLPTSPQVPNSCRS